MNENKSYHTIREFNLGQTKIEVCIAEIPTEDQIKQRLTKVYDVINDIAIKAERRGVDTSKWFYTAKQLQKIKTNNLEKFI